MKTLWERATDFVRRAEGLEVTEVQFGHLTQYAQELVREIMKNRVFRANLERQYAQLETLYHQGSVVDETHNSEYSGKIKAITPTHFTVGKDGRMVFLRRTENRLLSWFLSAQPFKTYRHPLSTKQDWKILTLTANPAQPRSSENSRKTIAGRQGSPQLAHLTRRATRKPWARLRTP